MEHAVGNQIILMDDDLQHPPESIKNIYDELEKGYESCYTYYSNRQHHFIKRFISWINNLVSSYLLNKPFEIYLSSFFSLSFDSIKKLFLEEPLPEK